jgi:hypothetical protein
VVVEVAAAAALEVGEVEILVRVALVLGATIVVAVLGVAIVFVVVSVDAAVAMHEVGILAARGESRCALVVADVVAVVLAVV